MRVLKRNLQDAHFLEEPDKPEEDESSTVFLTATTISQVQSINVTD